tara:strand:+ start:1023 stop:1280 length:258 start_codon:yes stop_codon:yes gene_type:complete
MNTFSITMPTTASQLIDLFPDLPPRVDTLIIQNVEGNAGVLYFGESSNQPFTLVAPNFMVFAPGYPRGLYVKGSSGSDTLVVGYR